MQPFEGEQSGGMRNEDREEEGQKGRERGRGGKGRTFCGLALSSPCIWFLNGIILF